MKILVVHQNFPGQFKHLAPALVARGDEVVGLSFNPPQGPETIPVRRATPIASTGSKLPWAQDFETKLLRAEAGFREAQALKQSGFEPDVIIGHIGWGDMLFLKDVWPSARMGAYCEYFYNHDDFESDFDPEYPPIANRLHATARLKLKSLPQRLFFDIADAGLAPTHFQANTYPDNFRKRITVIHDGIDTDSIKPLGDPWIKINNNLKLDKNSEIITFAARNLEPYRGYHIFMRALPAILAERPEAHVFIIGANGVGYGAAPPHSSWRDIYLNEVKDRIDLSRVHFVGFLPHRTMHELLALSRAHIYLTYPFVLSWSLLEAMALEAPIVASDTAPVREIITGGVNGYLTPFLDAAALARTVAATVENAGDARKIGARARQTIREEYDLKRICLPAQIRWVDELAAMTARPALFD